MSSTSGTSGARGLYQFGQLLAAARRYTGLSRQEVAHAADVHAEFYAAVERGNKAVSVGTFARLWQVLGFDANQLVRALPVRVGPVVKRQRKAPGVRRGRVRGAAGEFAGFGRLLARTRREAKISQVALVHAVECGRRHVARLEAGQSLPSLALFAKLWHVLAFDANELLAQLIGEPPSEPYFGFGRVIESARVALDLTRLHVARAALCELGYYARVERGAELPTLRSAVHIHRVVRYDANEAFRWLWETNTIAKVA